jgi:hypothetical protein
VRVEALYVGGDVGFCDREDAVVLGGLLLLGDRRIELRILTPAELAETPATTGLLWQNQVFVALPSHAYLETYYAPFAPQPRLDRFTGHGVVGWTDDVQPGPMGPGYTITCQWWAGRYSV